MKQTEKSEIWETLMTRNNGLRKEKKGELGKRKAEKEDI